MTSETSLTTGLDRQRVLTPAPSWFHTAIEHPSTSHSVEVDGCPINYLRWQTDSTSAHQRGLLFVHGGGAHAHWWRFIAPFFTSNFQVTAIDLSGMGDSGHRDRYSDDQRVEEIRAVLQHADLGPYPFVVGHSFGGYIMMRFGATYGCELGGTVIVDSPVRNPQQDAIFPPPPDMRRMPQYDSFDDALARFRLLPPQPCANDYLVDFIARHSLKEVNQNWIWKFDVSTMRPDRYEFLFHDDLQHMTCPAALIYGQKSALVNRETAMYMSTLMGPTTPIVEIPEAHHHVMLDQPLSFVAAVRTLLDVWVRSDRSSNNGQRSTLS